jgi:uncharacterized protein YceH (UPF0502 family)
MPNRPFEHEARLKELLGGQAEINAALDLDKSDAQAAQPAEANIELPARISHDESSPATAVRATSLKAPHP